VYGGVEVEGLVTCRLSPSPLSLSRSLSLAISPFNHKPNCRQLWKKREALGSNMLSLYDRGRFAIIPETVRFERT